MSFIDLRTAHQAFPHFVGIVTPISVPIQLLKPIQLQELGGQQWFNLELADAFTAHFNANDGSGACNGGWKNAKFM